MVFFKCMYMLDVWSMMFHVTWLHSTLYIPIAHSFVVASSIGILLNMSHSTPVMTRGSTLLLKTKHFPVLLVTFLSKHVGTFATRSSCRSFQIALATTAWQHGVGGNKHWSCGEMQRSDLEVGYLNIKEVAEIHEIRRKWWIGNRNTIVSVPFFETDLDAKCKLALQSQEELQVLDYWTL